MSITPIDEPPSLPAPQHFEAMLHPNRSLGDTGFLLLMTGIALVSGLIGAGFALIGAWPVTGFLGLDALLLYVAFRWHFRQSRQLDMIKLDKEKLTVRRLLPDKKEQTWHFETAWVQVVQEDRKLMLRSHGDELVIGSFLTLDERRTFAQALQAAIRAARHPAPDQDPTPKDGAIDLVGR